MGWMGREKHVIPGLLVLKFSSLIHSANTNQFTNFELFNSTGFGDQAIAI